MELYLIPMFICMCMFIGLYKVHMIQISKREIKRYNNCYFCNFAELPLMLFCLPKEDLGDLTLVSSVKQLIMELFWR